MADPKRVVEQELEALQSWLDQRQIPLRVRHLTTNERLIDQLDAVSRRNTDLELKLGQSGWLGMAGRVALAIADHLFGELTPDRTRPLTPLEASAVAGLTAAYVGTRGVGAVTPCSFPQWLELVRTRGQGRVLHVVAALEPTPPGKDDPGLTLPNARPLTPDLPNPSAASNSIANGTGAVHFLVCASAPSVDEQEGDDRVVVDVELARVRVREEQLAELAEGVVLTGDRLGRTRDVRPVLVSLGQVLFAGDLTERGFVCNRRCTEDARLVGDDTDRHVTLRLVIGRTTTARRQVHELEPGRVVALEHSTEGLVDLVVDGKIRARGELVDIAGQLGVRILRARPP